MDDTRVRREIAYCMMKEMFAAGVKAHVVAGVKMNRRDGDDNEELGGR